MVTFGFDAKSVSRHTKILSYRRKTERNQNKLHPKMLLLKVLLVQVEKNPLKTKDNEPMRSPLEESAIAKQVYEEAALSPSPDGYSSIEEVDMIEEEDALRDGSQDASRRRIFEMKGLIKSLLFEDGYLTRESLVNTRADLSENEIDVCLLIVIRLKLYIPSKANYESISH
ncbi:hypothetical protein BD560DRAFT_422364 [Blakeslea trispora]|nr:hypothetical protein BD560DRAFT_422364 [Blakeslea trispora]